MSTNPLDPGAFTAPGDPPSAAEPITEKGPSIGQLLSTLIAQVTFLIRGEIELTKKKLAALLIRTVKGTAALVVAAVLALYLLGWILHTVEIGLSYLLPSWAASLIVVVFLLLIVAILVIIGVKQLKKAFEEPPAPQEGIKDDLDAFKKGLGK